MTVFLFKGSRGGPGDKATACGAAASLPHAGAARVSGM